MTQEPSQPGDKPAESSPAPGSVGAAADKPPIGSPPGTDPQGTVRARATVPPSARGSASVDSLPEVAPENPSTPAPRQVPRMESELVEQAARPGPYPPAGPGSPHIAPSASRVVSASASVPTWSSSPAPAPMAEQAPTPQAHDSPPHPPPAPSPTPPPGHPPSAPTYPPPFTGPPPTANYPSAANYPPPPPGYPPSPPGYPPAAAYPPAGPSREALQGFGEPAHTDAAILYPGGSGKSRRSLLIGLIATGAVLLLAVVGVIAVTTFGGSGIESFAVGRCVRQSGTKATPARCNTAGAFKIIDKVEGQDRCPDANQPFVVLRHDAGKEEFLCLRPSTEK